MDKKWNIMDKKVISEKCCQMEAKIRDIFKSPNNWVNGFIRLVSLEGTWYHHRETDIFIPMTQNYIEKTYMAETKPEKGSTRVKSGLIYWDFMSEEEALKVLPNLPGSNMPKAVGASSLGEKCKNKKILLRDGKVYDDKSKGVRALQKNEGGSILQIYHLEDQYSRKEEVSWFFDIYLWAKAGIIPSVLYAFKDCWNTMQFLIDNFNNIDFDEFIALGEKDEEVIAVMQARAEEEKQKEAQQIEENLQETKLQSPEVSENTEEITAELKSIEKTAESEELEVTKRASDLSKVTEEPEGVEMSKVMADPSTEKDPIAVAQTVEGMSETVKELEKTKESTVNTEEIEEFDVTEVSEKTEGPETVKSAETVDKLEATKAPEETREPEILKEAEKLEEPEIVESAEKVDELEATKALERMEELEALQKAEKLEEPKVVKGVEKIEESEAVKEIDKAEELEVVKGSEKVEEPEAARALEKIEEQEAEKSIQDGVKSETAKALDRAEYLETTKAAVELDILKDPEESIELEGIEKPVAEENLEREPECSEKSEAIEETDISETQKMQRVWNVLDALDEPEEIVEPESYFVPESAERDAEETQNMQEVLEVLDTTDALEEKMPEVMAEPEVTAKDKPAEVEVMAEPEREKAPEEPIALQKLSGETEDRLQEQNNQAEVTEEMDMDQEGMYDNTDRIQELLDCDKERCRLEPYDRDILYDIIRGHWELFDQTTDGKMAGKDLIARDPRQEIRQGVVGIDFGTKSTVVVRQDTTNRIVPIRIGTGNLSSEVKDEDFENPSIIEFTNVKKFMEAYQKEEGRPHTSCNDIFVSYDACEDFKNCKPEDFYAYFSELKQWANRDKGSVVIKDKQKREYYLGEHMNPTESVVNPIELYAYYIGLYINNMRNGIYLKYLMTFPVGYAKEVRDFIANSFYEGIRKSLPASILNDAKCMEQFKVELGISESAAYAVTALEQSHLEPKDETEQLMYGIFDFGGGTTDFDFGICRGATEEEYEKDAYDYVLECFGADSDVTLGGENILELMAYQVYQQNLEVFREKRITFTLPLGENSFAGSETLLINSQIARRNMAILKEELRPLWHQEQGWRKKYQLDNETQGEVDREGIVVSLYNMDGEPVPQCILEFSSQDLVEMIKNRIQKGVDSFFQCLIKIFLCKKEVRKEENNIYIFLAGNSSKSVFVKELFQKKIEEYYSRAKGMTEELGNAHFVLIDPLAGERSDCDHYVPNAKTGVAYGLLKSRDGSSIKIVKNHETDSMQQSRFHYYLGRDRRHHFDCRFSPTEIDYKKWVPFQGATREVVRIYYTNNPMADAKLEQLSIENVPYKEINIEVKEDAYLFIRTVEPDMVEYVVAKEVEDISGSEIKKCYFN